MNISDLTPEQRKEVLHHLRMATIARATQWDHEGCIEAILDREIDVDLSGLAVNVALDSETTTPEEITWLTEENLADYIPDEPA